jgi:arylformamidase
MKKLIATIEIGDAKLRVDLSRPIDISIPLQSGRNHVNAFHLPPVSMEPFRYGSFIGDVSQGGSCNVNTITFNPHGNGTHTETVGHITRIKYPIYLHLREFYFLCRLISLEPVRSNDDKIIVKEQLEEILKDGCSESLIIRTLPNDERKLTAQYSGANPPYVDPSASAYVRDLGVKHLLLDIPSIDREDDGGRLLSHRAFWNYPGDIRTDCTITELAYIPSHVADGIYLLNLQVISIDNDASPSKPLLYDIL